MITEIKSTDIESLVALAKHLTLDGYQVLIMHDSVFYKAIIVKPEVDKHVFELTDWYHL
jgi:hypothetical protein